MKYLPLIAALALAGCGDAIEAALVTWILALTGWSLSACSFSRA